jgi:porphobilinogen synthase
LEGLLFELFLVTMEKMTIKAIASFPSLRLRRLRQHPVLRELMRETEISRSDLIAPIFIKGEIGERIPIGAMPGQYQVPLKLLQEEIQQHVDLGIRSILLFGVPPYKDAYGSNSFDGGGVIQKAIPLVREVAPEMLIMTDVCFCEYTDHGHCGFLSEKTGKLDLDNDATLELLVKQAVSHAEAGADMVLPSGMVDGAVKAIRAGLDAVGFEHLPILSHSVKYNSSLYGPFREAAEGAPSFGDRSTHQMDPANVLEALREVALDVEEGADVLMVKPAHAYLDVICRVKQNFPHIPLCAYHTSGEYSMIKAACERGWLDEKKTVTEILRGIRRAGADFLITYYAKEIAEKEFF